MRILSYLLSIHFKLIAENVLFFPSVELVSVLTKAPKLVHKPDLF